MVSYDQQERMMGDIAKYNNRVMGMISVFDGMASLIGVSFDSVSFQKRYAIDI